MASASPFAPQTFILSPFPLSKYFIPSTPLLFSIPLHHISVPLAARRLFGSSAESPEASPEDPRPPTFGRAIELFNAGDYYSCHDFLEEMWFSAKEPVRTLLHGILQCAVGFHHLFNQNHRGAMMELGEGLCKLRKMGFEDGPFLEFEKEVSEALEFLYQTQKELAACTEELCLPMDGSEASYQLLGSFAAGQKVYNVHIDKHGVAYLIFTNNFSSSVKPLVKVPKLHATEEDLKRCQYV